MTEYILTIEDAYRVFADDEEEAITKLLENIGEEPFEVYNVEVLEVIE